MMNGTANSSTRLLVGLDGSPLAETVLPLVSTLATALGARVTLLHVLEHNPPSTVHGQPHLTTMTRCRETALTWRRNSTVGDSLDDRRTTPWPTLTRSSSRTAPRRPLRDAPGSGR